MWSEIALERSNSSLRFNTPRLATARHRGVGHFGQDYTLDCACGADTRPISSVPFGRFCNCSCEDPRNLEWVASAILSNDPLSKDTMKKFKELTS